MSSCEKVQDNRDAGLRPIPVQWCTAVFMIRDQSDHRVLPGSLPHGWGRFGQNLETFYILLTVTALKQDTSLDWIETVARTETQIPPLSTWE